METGIIDEIVNLMVKSLTGIGEGVGSALSSMATSIFLTSGGGLSVFGSLVIIFAGLSLAFGLTRFVLGFLTSLGSRNS